jgi:hypothetical protein
LPEEMNRERGRKRLERSRSQEVPVELPKRASLPFATLGHPMCDPFIDFRFKPTHRTSTKRNRLRKFPLRYPHIYR